MVQLIQGQTKKIMYDCCKKYADRISQPIENIQLILSVKESNSEVKNCYTICENYSPKVEYDILQVLNVRIDFRGYSLLAPPFIRKAISRFAEKYGVTPFNLKVMCIAEADKNVNLYLYDEFTFLEEIDFQQLFSEEDIEMPN